MDEPRPDDAFERELRRTLAAGGRAPGPHLDAELAAAWVDGRLDAAAARTVETHLAGCQDCQALFATLARISPESSTAPGELAWWRRRAGWLLPATVAAAAALVIWVAVPSQRPASVAVPQSFEPRADDAATPPAATAPPAPAPAPQSEADAERSRSLAAARSDAQSTSADVRQAAPTTPPPPAVAAPPAETERRDSLADASATPPADSRKESIVVRGETPPVDVQPSRRAALPPGAAAAPTAPPAAAERQEATTALTGRLANENAQFAAGVRGAPLTVVAADGAARWRRTGARVEFAPRAEAGFSPLALPVSADAIVAGSAPGGTVCWFVGGAGVVLVTTDGARFTRAAAPAVTPLVAVTAGDSRTATVTAADGRRFRTTDGGASWTPD